MSAALLALLLASAPVAPLAPKQSTVAVVVKSPRTALPPLRAFLNEAGRYAGTLKPQELGRALGAALGVDLLDLASLEEAGLDADLPITLSSGPSGFLTCYTVKGGAAVPRLEATLAGIGKKATAAYKGATLTGATAGKSWRAGYFKKGSVVCSVSPGGEDALAALKGGVDAMGGGLGATKGYKTAVAGLTGGIVVFGQSSRSDATAGFEVVPTPTSLEVKGRLAGIPPLLDKPREDDRLATFTAVAPLVSTLTLAPKALGDPAGPVGMAVSFLLSNACRGCADAAQKPLLEALKTRLTGQAGLIVAGLDPSSAGKPLSQYFLFPHAYLLPLKDAAGVKAALDEALAAVEKAGGKITAGEPFRSVGVGQRAVLVGIQDDVLIIANDAAARELALASLAKSVKGRPAHAASVILDGAQVAMALSRISLLDAPRSPELGALFAVSVEAGSLLRAAGKILLEADPEAGGVHAELHLKLK